MWAYIIKFNQKDKIRSLETLTEYVARLAPSHHARLLIQCPSFERCLTEPVAIRPDDVLEGILIQFLRNLKPTLRNLS